MLKYMLNTYPLCSNYVQLFMLQFPCSIVIISNLWINNKWLKHKLTCQNVYHRKDRYTLIEQSVIDCSIRVTDCSIRVYRFFCDDKQEFILLHKYSTYYASIMLNYASIIGGSLLVKYQSYLPPNSTSEECLFSKFSYRSKNIIAL